MNKKQRKKNNVQTFQVLGKGKYSARARISNRRHTNPSDIQRGHENLETNKKSQIRGKMNKCYVQPLLSPPRLLVFISSAVKSKRKKKQKVQGHLNYPIWRYERSTAAIYGSLFCAGVDWRSRLSPRPLRDVGQQKTHVIIQPVCKSVFFFVFFMSAYIHLTVSRLMAPTRESRTMFIIQREITTIIRTHCLQANVGNGDSKACRMRTL